MSLPKWRSVLFGHFRLSGYRPSARRMPLGNLSFSSFGPPTIVLAGGPQIGRTEMLYLVAGGLYLALAVVHFLQAVGMH